MIRPFTCVCMLMAAGSGLYLYQTKHRAQLLDHEIARTFKQIDVTRDRIASLKAEWALLNEPERLKDLAQQHSSLRTLAPTQFLALDDLSAHLPAPLPPGPPALPPEDAPMAPMAPVAAARPASRILAANDRAGADHPADRPAAATRLPAPRPNAAAPQAGPPAPVAVATAVPASVPRAPVPAAAHILAPVMTVAAGPIGSASPLAPGSIGESVARAARLRAAEGPQVMAAAAQPPAAYAAPALNAPALNSSAYSPPAPAAPVFSALGGAGRAALPPPVPFGAAAR